MFNYAPYAKAITFRLILKTETAWGLSSPQWCINLFTPLKIMFFFCWWQIPFKLLRSCCYSDTWSLMMSKVTNKSFQINFSRSPSSISFFSYNSHSFPTPIRTPPPPLHHTKVAYADGMVRNIQVWGFSLLRHCNESLSNF